MRVFDFLNYRDYIRSYLKSLPKAGHGELSRIAVHLRMSATLLSQIISGMRNFSLDHAIELSEYLRLTELETDYLYLLIELERAGTQKNKNHLKKKLLKIKNESLSLSHRVRTDKSLSESERFVFYSSWIYAAIHLFLDTNKKGKSIEEISKRFDISRQRATDIIYFFQITGLSREENGKYLATAQSTFAEHGSAHFLKHHSNWRIKSIQKSENLEKNELMFTAPVSVSKKDFDLIREKLAQFITEISEIVKNSDAEDVANLNLDWFWV